METPVGTRGITSLRDPARRGLAEVPRPTRPTPSPPRRSRRGPGGRHVRTWSTTNPKRIPFSRNSDRIGEVLAENLPTVADRLVLDVLARYRTDTPVGSIAEEA